MMGHIIIAAYARKSSLLRFSLLRREGGNIVRGFAALNPGYTSCRSAAVTTGLDPVVRAEGQQQKRAAGHQPASSLRGLRDQVRQ